MIKLKDILNEIDRHGVPKNATKAQLKKIRSNPKSSKGAKDLAHWKLNMHHNEAAGASCDYKMPGESNAAWRKRCGPRPLGAIGGVSETLSHNAAEEYRKELIELLGKPSYDTDQESGWFKPKIPAQYGSYTMLNRDLEKVYIVNEEIPHNFPADHIDFAYSTAKIKQWQQNKGAHIIDPKMIADFAGVTGSIIIDPLKAVSYTHLTLPTIYSV